MRWRTAAPHRGARLSTGPVYEPCKIACLDHGWSIDLRTGAVDAPERGQVRAFPVWREGDALYVGVDASG
jgi:nitrite reductase/ring-hydroxylating ferredoxin subunit